MVDKEFLSRKEASAFLHSLGCPISPRTLEKMACNNNAGHGPPYTRYRWKQVTYARADLIEWAKKEAEVIGKEVGAGKKT